MTPRRVVAPWFLRPTATAAPPGVDPGVLARSMFEDLADTIAGLDLVETAALAVPGHRADVAALMWPGAPVLEATPPDAAAALQVLAAAGADAAAVVAGDAPDLPPMLIGKAMRGLGSHDAALCAAEGGGLVFLAARCPVPDWLVAAAPDLDDADVVERVRAAAPRRAAVATTPGWHRLREPADVSRLDPGLEGWDLTRAVLAGRPLV